MSEAAVNGLVQLVLQRIIQSGSNYDHRHTAHGLPLSRGSTSTAARLSCALQNRLRVAEGIVAPPHRAPPAPCGVTPKPAAVRHVVGR